MVQILLFTFSAENKNYETPYRNRSIKYHNYFFSIEFLVSCSIVLYHSWSCINCYTRLFNCTWDNDNFKSTRTSSMVTFVVFYHRMLSSSRMNSITSVDHKSADSAVHETTVNAVGKLCMRQFYKKNYLIPLNRACTLDSAFSFSFFLSSKRHWKDFVWKLKDLPLHFIYRDIQLLSYTIWDSIQKKVQLTNTYTRTSRERIDREEWQARWS